MATKKKKARKAARRTKAPEKKAKGAIRTPPRESRKGAKRVKKGKKANKVKFPSKLIPLKDIDKKTRTLISEADTLEAAYLDNEDKFREKLIEIRKKLGGSSFQHPDRGPMSIMERGYVFWRKKPSGK